MRFKAFNSINYQEIKQLGGVSEELRQDIGILSKILPFRTNKYVIDHLIDWSNPLEDPLFLMNFPVRQMIPEEDFQVLQKAVKTSNKRLFMDLWQKMNPHPAGQLTMNTPGSAENPDKFRGLQHKYRETVLFFPAAGQTCHAYCTFCFRWPQFTGISNFRFAQKDPMVLREYLSEHRNVTDLLVTGGDPLTMSTRLIRQYLDPVISSRDHGLSTIRIGTKSIAYWPYRYTRDKDADDLLRYFSRIIKSGYHLSLMAHISHPKELSTPEAEKAVRRIKETGASIRTQSPLLKHINDKPGVWINLWQKQVRMGMIPYYMFIARNTGPHRYFGVPVHTAFEIFNKAYSNVSGLARTVRGPSMSAMPGKIMINGISRIRNEKVFVLSFLQGRDPSWVGKPFFAGYRKDAYWLTDLQPAFGEGQFFYQEGLELMEGSRSGKHLTNIA